MWDPGRWWIGGSCARWSHLWWGPSAKQNCFVFPISQLQHSWPINACHLNSGISSQTTLPSPAAKTTLWHQLLQNKNAFTRSWSCDFHMLVFSAWQFLTSELFLLPPAWQHWGEMQRNLMVPQPLLSSQPVQAGEGNLFHCSSSSSFGKELWKNATFFTGKKKKKRCILSQIRSFMFLIAKKKKNREGLNRKILMKKSFPL